MVVERRKMGAYIQLWMKEMKMTKGLRKAGKERMTRNAQDRAKEKKWT